MAKYSFEFKKNIVQDYLNGKGSYRDIGRVYALPWENVRKWVRNYSANGDDGLMRSRKNKDILLILNFMWYSYIYQVRSLIKSWHYRKA